MLTKQKKNWEIQTFYQFAAQDIARKRYNLTNVTTKYSDANSKHSQRCSARCVLAAYQRALASCQ